MGPPARVEPLPVEVVSHTGAPVIAEKHAIGVDHRDDAEDEVVAEEPCVGVVADEEEEEAVADEGGGGLPGVHAGRDEHHALGLPFVGQRLRRGDGEEVDPPVLGGAAQQLAGEEVEALGLEVGQDPLEVRVRVGEAVCEVVDVVLPIEGEGEREDISAVVPRGSVVEATPGRQALPFGSGGGADERGHPKPEEVLGLAAVDEVEDRPLAGDGARDAEVEPHAVVRVVGVPADLEVVLEVPHGLDPPDVAALEVALEDHRAGRWVTSGAEKKSWIGN